MHARTRSAAPFNFNPAAVFDALERSIAQIDNNSYPPFNLAKVGDDGLVIEVAVAGFSDEEISISLEKLQLTIEGKPAEIEGEEPVFLHRGIARRAFRRSFRLGEYVEVKSAEMTNGLLTIRLAREVPEEAQPKRIEITRH